MSLPKSRILSTSKGFSAATEVHNNSPESSTVVNVNVSQNADNSVKEPSVPRPPSIPRPELQTEEQPQEVSYPHVFERDVEPQGALFNDKSKDNLINALSLLLNIVENNPLVVNKCIIADLDSLTQLISFLTEADAVDVQTSSEVECSCVNSPKFVAIDKILITKNNETLNFKYHYADANQTLDEHHISKKFVVDSSVQ